MTDTALRFPPRPPDRLRSFGRHELLEARCVRCGHRHHLDPAFLRRRYGDLAMPALRARLGGVECGGRHPELVRAWAPPGAVTRPSLQPSGSVSRRSS